MAELSGAMGRLMMLSAFMAAAQQREESCEAVRISTAAAREGRLGAEPAAAAPIFAQMVGHIAIVDGNITYNIVTGLDNVRRKQDLEPGYFDAVAARAIGRGAWHSPANARVRNSGQPARLPLRPLATELPCAGLPGTTARPLVRHAVGHLHSLPRWPAQHVLSSDGGIL